MTKIAIFYGYLLVVAGYSWWRGGQPERLVAALSVSAAVATSLLPFHHGVSFFHTEWGQLAIDAILFAALLVVAAYADRFWPIWFAAVQLLTVMVHLANVYDPSILPLVYARAVGELSYPALASLAIGAARHRQRRGEFDWSWES